MWNLGVLVEVSTAAFSWDIHSHLPFRQVNRVNWSEYHRYNETCTNFHDSCPWNGPLRQLNIGAQIEILTEKFHSFLVETCILHPFAKKLYGRDKVDGTESSLRSSLMCLFVPQQANRERLPINPLLQFECFRLYLKQQLIQDGSWQSAFLLPEALYNVIRAATVIWSDSELDSCKWQNWIWYMLNEKLIGRLWSFVANLVCKPGQVEWFYHKDGVIWLICFPVGRVFFSWRNHYCYFLLFTKMKNSFSSPKYSNKKRTRSFEFMPRVDILQCLMLFWDSDDVSRKGWLSLQWPFVKNAMTVGCDITIIHVAMDCPLLRNHHTEVYTMTLVDCSATSAVLKMVFCWGMVMVCVCVICLRPHEDVLKVCKL